jgi:hypothetical protein
MTMNRWQKTKLMITIILSLVISIIILVASTQTRNEMLMKIPMPMVSWFLDFVDQVFPVHTESLRVKTGLCEKKLLAKRRSEGLHDQEDLRNKTLSRSWRERTFGFWENLTANLWLQSEREQPQFAYISQNFADEAKLNSLG